MTASSNWKLTLEEILEATGGDELNTHAEDFSGVGTDTRTDLTGKLFIALKGDNYDAHDFLDKAAQAGATGALVHRLPKSRVGFEQMTLITVDDTLDALQDLGRFWRKKMSARILAVTGTNGKTTTKEFAAAIIGAEKKVQYSKGSLNNHWGVPLSLLSIEPQHEVAVIEMGMNHPGELTDLIYIAEPDVVMVTMVGRGHLEGVGSIEGVAAAKEEMYEQAPDGALAIFNLENPYTEKMYVQARRRNPKLKFLAFGGPSVKNQTATLDVSLEVVSADEKSLQIKGAIRGVSGSTEVPVFGAHNITNLMAAACLALSVEISPEKIWKALPLCQSGWGRNQWVKTQSGARVLFDAYNANPESMRAAIENFAHLKSAGRKIAVLGEMREMGEAANSVHRELGEAVGRLGFDVIAFVGPSRAAFEAGIRASDFSKKLFVTGSYENNLASEMVNVLDSTDIVLIKGSRGMQLERILEEWKPIDFKKK
jgi:UDP-N-acetylmuramoyl-tripeptide--D-alanyl-D-alanine ligase